MINTEMIKDWAKKNHYRKFERGSNCNLVILGEEHGKKDMRNQQELLISKLKPKYLLHEGFEACVYNPKTDKMGVLKYRSASEFDSKQAVEGNKHVVNWSKKYNIPVIGCNISSNEFDQFGKTLQEKFPDRYEDEPPIGMFGAQGDEIILEGGAQTSLIGTGEPLGAEDRNVKLYRDKRIGEIIAEQATKTKKSLMAIIGADHMRPASSLHNILKKAKIGYICVDQTYKRK